MGVDTIICNGGEGGGGLIMIAYEERKNFLSVIKCNFEEKNSHQL